MRNLLKREEAFMFGLSIFLFSKLDYAWWWYPVLILTPDLSRRKTACFVLGMIRFDNKFDYS